MKCCGAQSLSAFLTVQCVLQANCLEDRCELCMSSRELFKIFVFLNLLWVLCTYKQKIVMTLFVSLVAVLSVHFVSLVAVLSVQYFSKHTLYR